MGVCLQAQLIAQSIGQAFQVAYMEFLKANGIDDPTLIKEIDYQEVLNQQEIFGEELYLFSNKDMQKEVCLGIDVSFFSVSRKLLLALRCRSLYSGACFDTALFLILGNPLSLHVEHVERTERNVLIQLCF